MKRIISFLFLVAAASCIDPYVPNLKDYNSLLVVEGLITNENSSYIIKLYRTTSRESADPEKVTDADVYITDENGIKTYFQDCGDGNYKSDSTSFKGAIGQNYTLHILTRDGLEYRSEECTMIPVAAIDKLYYERGEEISELQGELFIGLKIFLITADATGMNQYFRWTFEETWKSIVTNPCEYTYTYVNDTTFYFEPVPVIKNICWKENKSTAVITNSITSDGPNYLDKQEIQFIAPVKTDRLTKQYSILVKQYSVSKKEYEFWANLKKTGETGGDIFASQPYSVVSNIQNVNNPAEMVLGYFEVSAVSRQRLFITTKDLSPLDLPFYKTHCFQISKHPDDWLLMEPKQSWDGIYHLYTDKGEYVFIRPQIKDGIINTGRVYKSNLVKFVFAPRACSICEDPGIATKPDFWIDLE